MRSCSPPGWPPRVSSRSARSIPRFCSAPSIPSCTMSACRICRWSSAWIAAGLSADDGPTHHGLFDISYLRADPEPGAHGPEGRRRTGRHAVHRHAMERPHRGALSARPGPGHAGEGRSPRHPGRQGRTAAAQRPRPRGHLRARRAGADGRRDRPQAGGRRHRRGGDQCPLRQADRRRDAGVLRAHASR